MTAQTANPAGLTKGDVVTIPANSRTWYGWKIGGDDRTWEIRSIGPNGLAVIAQTRTGYREEVAASILVKA